MLIRTVLNSACIVKNIEDLIRKEKKSDEYEVGTNMAVKPSKRQRKIRLKWQDILQFSLKFSIK